MYILGLQKLTLLDYPEHLAAILFLDGCNFRCPFCHNSELVLYQNHRNSNLNILVREDGSLPENESVLFSDNRNGRDPDFKSEPSPENGEELYSEDEILEFLKKRAGMLDGVCISGGEPTLHRDLPALIFRIKDLGYDVKLDTNGTNPDMIRSLLDNNLLDYIAMDIKAGRGNYTAAAGIRAKSDFSSEKTGADPARCFLSRIQRSIDIIRNSGIDYEFRTTVVKGIHTEEDFEDIARWLGGTSKSSVPASGLTDGPPTTVSAVKAYYLQSFRDCDTILLPNHPFSAFTEEEMLRFLSIIKKTIPNACLRGTES